MHITESDLFYGLDLKVMSKIADICSEEQYAESTVLFKEGENALRDKIVHSIISQKMIS